ncbi:MAG: hypothetical protein A2X08_05880 [Bacteroidetes bacterium GWA2_32_17]|nr:MAG: hypothetical protein A2X08_05880 [Bacteroidetes bacterium GWA2_32_17]
METKNQFGERIESAGGIILNLEYWDCECEKNFIHRINEKKCLDCNVRQENQPNSRESEIEMLIRVRD